MLGASPSIRTSSQDKEFLLVVILMEAHILCVQCYKRRACTIVHTMDRLIVIANEDAGGFMYSLHSSLVFILEWAFYCKECLMLG